MPKKEPAEIRFYRHVAMIPFHPCWEWTAFKDRTGYGKFSYYGGQLAHRFSYAMLKGPLVAGMNIDHMCRNRSCVNPDHLRQVTPRENAIYNSVSLQAKNHKKTHCIRGHALAGENLGLQKNGTGRFCILCAKAKQHEWYMARKIAK